VELAEPADEAVVGAGDEAAPLPPAEAKDLVLVR